MTIIPAAGTAAPARRPSDAAAPSSSAARHREDAPVHATAHPHHPAGALTPAASSSSGPSHSAEDSALATVAARRPADGPAPAGSSAPSADDARRLGGGSHAGAIADQVFHLPDLGEGLTEAEIIQWRVAVGDTVTVDQIVVEVETAKAAVEVPIPFAGTVTRLYGEPGTVIDAGAPLIAVGVSPQEQPHSPSQAGQLARFGESSGHLPDGPTGHSPGKPAGRHPAGDSGDSRPIDAHAPLIEVDSSQTQAHKHFQAEPAARFSGESSGRLPDERAPRSAGQAAGRHPAGDSGRSRPQAIDRSHVEAAERYREEERAGSGNVLIGYGTNDLPRSRRRRSASRPALRAQSDSPGHLHARRTTPGGTDHDAARLAPYDVHPLRHPDDASPHDGFRPRTDATRDADAPRVISPVVRSLARAHGIDLAAISPTGPGGVILRRDVDAAIAAAAARRPALASPAAPATTPIPSAAHSPSSADSPLTEAVFPHPAHQDADAPVRIPLRGVRRAVAEKLSRSRREIPDATTWVDADATALLELKDEINSACPDAKISTLALLARICVAALRRFPELNSRVDADRAEIVRLPRVNLGFAAQTDRGLVVPVVRDAHRLTLAELAASLRALTQAARDGAASPADLTGGTFTLNNYGVFGVDGADPIINHPEAAMLGVGRIADRPWAVAGELKIRRVTHLTLTFDHRVCDGGTAGGFLRFVADCVENPVKLFAHL